MTLDKGSTWRVLESFETSENILKAICVNDKNTLIRFYATDDVKLLKGDTFVVCDFSFKNDLYVVNVMKSNFPIENFLIQVIENIF